MWTVKLYSQSWGEPAVLTGGRTRTHTKRRDGHTDRTYLKLIAFLLAYLQPYMYRYAVVCLLAVHTSDVRSSQT